jgi:hypothetical protein
LRQHFLAKEGMPEAPDSSDTKVRRGSPTRRGSFPASLTPLIGH